MAAINKYSFESSIEKLARVLSVAYNVKVVFEGDQAKTDGKTIFLPFIKNLDIETRRDINGFLDHEVGHVKFTDFDILKPIKSRFLFDLINATEDFRIENKMFQAFPGTFYNINPLNEKLIAKINEKLETYPWPYRLIFGLNMMVADKPCTIDDEIAEYIEYCEEFVDDIRNAKSTKEIKEVCELIYKRVLDKLKEKEDEKKSGKKSAKGEPGEDEEEGADGEGEPLTKEEMEALAEHLKEAKSLGEKSMTDKEVTDERKKIEMDVHDMMEETIDKKLESEKKIPKSEVPEIGRGVVIPLTTRFDTVKDHTGKGNSGEYHKLRASILHVIGPVKRHLERVLKVKENARWSYERERGQLNPSAFINLRTQLNYRRPFKQMTRTETKNVAVEILIDLSGSMGGHKIECAKLTAIAMGESLKDLGIAFEITGFNSVGCPEMRTASSDGVHSGRTHEKLDLHVFKDFTSENMNGLTKIFSGTQNPDGECVVWATKRLMQRKEARKILIVLSDGQPATGDTDGALLRSDLKIKVEKIIKSGVECVGIGIMTDAVKHYYPKYVIVNDIDKLASEAMGQLSSIIRGGANG